MANWCVNYITFYGEKENIAMLKAEIDSIIDKIKNKPGHGFAPEGYMDAFDGNVKSSSDFMFDVETVDYTDGDEQLLIKYETKWDVSEDILDYLAMVFHVEFKGSCTEEQNRADTCSFIFGIFDTCDDMIVVKKTLAESGLEVDYMVEEKSYFGSEFLDDALDDCVDFFYAKFKAAVEDAKYQNEHEAWDE